MSRVFLLLISTAFCLASCGSDRGDPLAVSPNDQFGGSLVSGGHLSNVDVSEDTKFDFIQRVLLQLYDTYFEAIGVASRAPDQEQTVRILGSFTGNAMSNITIPGSPPSSGNSIYNLEMVFNDFSNTGRLFFGGTVEFTGEWRVVNGKIVPYIVKLSKGLAFAGDYSGTIEFDNFWLAIDAQGNLVDLIAWLKIPALERPRLPFAGGVTIVSGSSRLLFNPYYNPFG
ncbi:MAG: hypothetical protein FVQ81_13850 [Candidatus Glassbacteria bacterium]|nr:hypothetical protein [Candidatus Glassbacteria bacterium]